MKRKAGGREPDTEIKTRRAIESPFLNPARRRIFEFFCRFPCASPTRAKLTLDMSLSTLRWHMNKLIAKDFLKEKRLGRKIGIYPPALVPGEYCDPLIVINGNMERRIMAFVLKKSGSTQSEIMKRVGESQQNVQSHLKKLEKYDLVKVLKDGRFRRYYPGSVIQELEKAVQRKSKNFKADFFERLKKGGIEPSIRSFSKTGMIVETSVGSEHSAMIIPFTPISSILSTPWNPEEKKKSRGAMIGETLLKKVGGQREGP